MTRYFMEIEIPPSTGSGPWAKVQVEIPAEGQEYAMEIVK